MTPQEKAEEIYKNYRNETVYFAAIKMHEWTKQQMIDKSESICAEMLVRIEGELFKAGVKNINNRKEIENALEICYKYFKKAMEG